MHRAIKELRKDKDIVILPADKGNATVVMDRTEYVSKMNLMLEDKAYTRLKKDPTSKIERKITKSIRALEDEGYIGDKERKHLSPQCSTPPRIYGLPKIHKDGTPLRPIVSAIGSPTYRLAKKLAQILSPLGGKTESYVKNSSAFVQKVKETGIQDGEMMVSFDVVSLFTKVPVHDALQAVATLLAEDDTLDERTAIPIPEICALTALCLGSTYLFLTDCSTNRSRVRLWAHHYRQ